MDVQALLNCLRELLDVIDSLLVAVVDLLDDLERSMRLTKYLINLLTSRLNIPFLDLHAVISSLSTLYMEINVATLLMALDDSANIYSLFTTNNTSNIKLGIVKFVHLYGSLGRHVGTISPQGAAVVNPVVKTISDRGILRGQDIVIPLNEVSVIIGDLVIPLLIFSVVQLYVVLQLLRRLQLEYLAINLHLRYLVVLEFKESILNFFIIIKFPLE